MNLELEFDSSVISHIFGPFDAYVRAIEKTFHVIVVDRDGKIKIAGEKKENLESAKNVLLELQRLYQKGNEDRKSVV